MHFKQKATYSWIISSAVLALSILFPIVPCQTGANVPNAIYSWKMCRLSPDLMCTTELKTFFFGYTTSMTESYLILLVLALLITFGAFSILTRKKN
ncbi:hypothetical protein CMI41_02945 [Candidatus Pacearchaeota archaeon]|nr:hypothetical protein [Candidatus Pacearchaeota archaeon]